MWYDPSYRTVVVTKGGRRAMSALANVIRDFIDHNAKGIHGQNELAHAAGIRTSSLSYIMNKETALPRPSTITKLAAAMDVDGALLTALLGYPIQASGEPEERYVLLARQLEAFPWLQRRLDDFLRLPQAEFEEAMDYLAHRRRRSSDRSTR